MPDIVERLRDWADLFERTFACAQATHDAEMARAAAAEVERLRSELADVRGFMGTADAIRFEMLKGALDEIAALRAAADLPVQGEPQP